MIQVHRRFAAGAWLTRSAVVSTTITNLAMLGLTVVTGVVVARTLGPQGRGEFALLTATFGIALVVTELGQSAAVTYHCAVRPWQSRSIIRQGRRLMLRVGITACCIALAASWLLPATSETTRWGYRIAVLGVLLNCLGASYVYALQAIAPLRWNVARLAQPVIYLTLIMPLAATGTLTIAWLALALVLSTGTSMGVAVSLLRKMQAPPAPEKNESGPVVPSQLAYGLREASAGVPIGLNQNLDKLLLGGLVGAGPVGLYAAAASLLAMAAPFANAIGSVFFPRLARGAGREAMTAIVRRSLLNALFATLPLIALTAAAGPILIPAAFGSDFRGAAPLLWFLAPAALFRSLSTVSSGLLRGIGRPGLVALAQGSAAGVSALLVVVLAPVGGVRLAGLGVAGGELVGLLLGLAAVRRSLSLRPTSAEEVRPEFADPPTAHGGTPST